VGQKNGENLRFVVYLFFSILARQKFLFSQLAPLHIITNKFINLNSSLAESSASEDLPEKEL
jgi:hypothetical protein